ncbi:MAG TPA: YoaK family protein [Puia sp.]|nr:YoaK family protein [Puia sp.]
MNVEYRPNIGWSTFLLAMVAGFCDTATFVGGKSIFSAHVTGNLAFFAAQFALESRDASAWPRMLTFPVFVLAVMTGGWVAERARRKNSILFLEGIVLTLAGIAAILLPVLKGLDTQLIIYFVVLITTFGMGLQNAFGKLSAGATFGPTTVMTGNVTQAALELGNLIRKRGKADEASRASFKKLRITIGAFLTGCLIGGVLTIRMGLGTILIPGLAITICYLQEEYDRNVRPQAG